MSASLPAPPMASLAGPGRILLGVAGTVARRFGVDPVVVRLAFAVLGVAGGVGVAVYLVLWLVWLPQGDDRDPSRSAGRDPSTVRTVGVVLGLAGSLLILRDRTPGFHDGLVWPVALVASGLMLAWHQLIPADPAERRGSPWGSALLRVGGGVVLLGAGLGFLLATNLSIDAARDAAVASTVVVTGLLLVFGPWVLSLARTATRERAERIRADERAEVAAHVHDSVLQTLTLMQKRSTDPAAVATLARQQERELRRWLYGPRGGRHEGRVVDGADAGRAGYLDDHAGQVPTSFVEELARQAAEVEDRHQVRIDPVTVGDAAMDDTLRSVVAAAREALVNAAKFSGDRQPALYAQVGEGAVEVYVRDRGCGFDRATVPADRHGLTESIEGRMRRAGGAATVRTAPGDGTEVHLVLPHPPTAHRDGEVEGDGP